MHSTCIPETKDIFSCVHEIGESILHCNVQCFLVSVCLFTISVKLTFISNTSMKRPPPKIICREQELNRTLERCYCHKVGILLCYLSFHNPRYNGNQTKHTHDLIREYVAIFLLFVKIFTVTKMKRMVTYIQTSLKFRRAVETYTCNKVKFNFN